MSGQSWIYFAAQALLTMFVYGDVVKTQEAEGGSTEAIHLSSTQNTKETDLESVPLKHSLSSQDKLEESKVSQSCMHR